MFARACNKIYKINKNASRNGVDGVCVRVCVHVCMRVCVSFGFIFIIEEEERDIMEIQILMFLISEKIIIIFLFSLIYEVGKTRKIPSFGT